MKPQNPSSLGDVLTILRSYYRILVANIGFGSPSAYDTHGVGTTFPQDNGNGVLIRIGSNANPNGLANHWAGTNVATTVTHNLNRVPVGFFVASKDQTCDIYNASPFSATTSTITLYSTAGAADVLVYIF
jgi:hypothetical protein